ncbi:hypothetical protein A2311_03110 [candidate division WOR-1 bacterium RIFOXYB2_FULL_48_7]|uniref:RNA 2-O ribose methyltransferase substrate binding domain-containing protein n=1 Tax=candidate division WOR-1 bacterium RIFOXYB2_FULL_48_7 TaxID=1802583 RepID=A0A1F4TRL5_UNCSA|nr:MAG: hypothetical protein A2311_03110 [candidate division WOR-1 bacterium RIFOXYB2_FULL_48_7]
MSTKISEVKNLLEKRAARRRAGLFVVEGPHLIEEACEYLEYIVYCEKLPIVKELLDKGFPAIKVSREQFADLSQVETPQGVLGVARQVDVPLTSLQLATGHWLLIYCLGIQDPGNLGTIIRSADALGAGGIILSKGTVDLYNPKVVRATQGSLFHLPLVIVENDSQALAALKNHQVKILAATLRNAKDITAIDLRPSVAIVLGNEGAGLPDEIVTLADEKIKIPMPGGAESLNVGMAATVMLYEALRQRI